MADILVQNLNSSFSMTREGTLVGQSMGLEIRMDTATNKVYIRQWLQAPLTLLGLPYDSITTYMAKNLYFPRNNGQWEDIKGVIDVQKSNRRIQVDYPIDKGFIGSVLRDVNFQGTNQQNGEFKGSYLYKTAGGENSQSGTWAVKYSGSVTISANWWNSAPTLTLNTANNATLYENDTFLIDGSTVDTDVDDVVTVKYQIDSGAVRNLHSAVSNGSTPIDFSKTLTYTDGVLNDGNTILTSRLDKDTPHTVSVWSEDGAGGKSNIITRTFFVVPNRPPSVTMNPIASDSDLINSNVINVSGAVADLDNNDVTVVFSINGGEEQQVYQGPPSSFTFNILLNDLKVGANTVIVKATDIYDTSGTKTLTINKTHNAVPINKAVARYQITAPTGRAKSILLWITRTLGPLVITAEVSLTNEGEAENYVPLIETNSGITNGLRQDEFAYEGTVDKEKIILKITYDRTDASVIDTIKQISGVLF